MLHCQREERLCAGAGSYAECLCNAGDHRSLHYRDRLLDPASSSVCPWGQRCHLRVCQRISENLSSGQPVCHDRAGAESLYQCSGFWQNRNGDRHTGCGGQSDPGSCLHFCFSSGSSGGSPGNGDCAVFVCSLGIAFSDREKTVASSERKARDTELEGGKADYDAWRLQFYHEFYQQCGSGGLQPTAPDVWRGFVCRDYDRAEFHPGSADHGGYRYG